MKIDGKFRKAALRDAYAEMVGIIRKREFELKQELERIQEVKAAFEEGFDDNQWDYDLDDWTVDEMVDAAMEQVMLTLSDCGKKCLGTRDYGITYRFMEKFQRSAGAGLVMRLRGRARDGGAD